MASADIWELSSVKFPVRGRAMSEIVQHAELARINKNTLQKNKKAHYVPVLNESHAKSRSRF